MNKELGQKIKQLRKENKMTLKDLGSRLGVSESYIHHMENGNRKISIELLQSVADVFNEDISYFFETKEVQLTEEEQVLISYKKELESEGITVNDIKEWVEIARNIRKNK